MLVKDSFADRLLFPFLLLTWSVDLRIQLP
jgi:hypothetical protein